MTDTQQRSIPACPECRPDEPHFADCPVHADQITQLALLARSRRKKIHAHRWIPVDESAFAASQTQPGIHICDLCGLSLAAYEARQRRGRTNRSRGNSIEREVAKQLGLTRVGMYGGAEDAGRHDEPFIVSVKSGSGYFSERYWDQLRRLPANAMQTALLVVTDAPGPGHRRRAYVVLDLDSWKELHG